MHSTLKKALKHLLGRDLWLKTECNPATEFHGSPYGGWAVLAGSVHAGSVIYSFGIGEDASFDLSLIQCHGCTVHGFDPTPKSLDWVRNNIREPRFVLHPWALGVTDGTLELWLPDNPDHVSASLVSAANRSKQCFQADCRSLESIMKELGHESIDVLKMDIEGAEYDVLHSLAQHNLFRNVSQLLVEFHHRMEGFNRTQTLHALQTLRHCGFRIAWVSEVGHEVLFIKP